MARIRSIKPEIRRDRKLARVSRDARYTFVLLWTLCDDQGFFFAEPRQLIGDLYPHDKDVTEDQLEAWLSELAPFLEFYEHEDGKIGKVRNWLKHQRIDKPSQAFLENLTTDLQPIPRECSASVPRDPRETSTSGVLSPESRVLSPESRVLSPESRVLSPESKDCVELVPIDPVAILCDRLQATEAASNGTKQKEAALQLGVELVFNYWMAKMSHPRAVLDRKRRTRLATRLRENGCDVSELLYAIDGAKRDDWLMGRDAKSTKKFDGIETLFRDREQVEKLVEMAPNSGERPHPLLQEAENGTTS